MGAPIAPSPIKPMLPIEELAISMSFVGLSALLNYVSLGVEMYYRSKMKLEGNQMSAIAQVDYTSNAFQELSAPRREKTLKLPSSALIESESNGSIHEETIETYNEDSFHVLEKAVSEAELSDRRRQVDNLVAIAAFLDRNPY